MNNLMDPTPEEFTARFRATSKVIFELMAVVVQEIAPVKEQIYKLDPYMPEWSVSDLYEMTKDLMYYTLLLFENEDEKESIIEDDRKYEGCISFSKEILDELDWNDVDKVDCIQQEDGSVLITPISNANGKKVQGSSKKTVDA